MSATTLAPAVQPTGSVLPMRLGPAACSSFATYLRVLGDASAVSAQQDLALGLVPTLPQDQALARSHAGDWIVGAAPDLLTALTAVGGHARVVRAFAHALEAHADEIDAGGDPAQFDHLCAALRSHVARHTVAIADSRADFKLYRQSVKDDGVRFAELGQQIPVAYAPDLVRLQTQLGALRDRLAADNAVVTGAVAALLPGMVAMGVAAGLTVLDVGQAKVVLQKGYTMVKKAVDAVDDAMADSAKAVAEYRTALATFTHEKAELAVFTTVAGNVARLTATTHDAITALDDLATGWRDEDSVLVWLSALAHEVPTGSAVRAAVDDLVSRWDTLGTIADGYLVASVELPTT